MAEALSKRINPFLVDRERKSEVRTRKESLPREGNRNLILVAFIAGFVSLGVCLFYVWSHHQMISLGYEASQTVRQERELLEKNKKLRLELAALKSPSRIERIAREELGMVNPQKEQLIIVR